ncbi:MAG: LysM domain-containing protein, partial [Chloroflexi bacterium]|nr:LysM domain-containing protein [Chloroflexota bacterium]
MVGKKSPRLAFGLAALLLALLSFLPATVRAESTYVVQSGDSLSSIAARFSSSVEAIAAANNIANPDLIFAGKTLQIPSAAPNRSVAERVLPTPNPGPGSILANRRLLTYYGNPYDARMGILGALSQQELVDALQRRASMYAALSDKPVQPAIHFIVTVAQGSPGSDGKWRARMPESLVQEYADLAAQNGMLMFIDIQVGHSTVQEELAPWISVLSQPHVHLALDPEFDMLAGQTPGDHLGHMTADEINYAQQVLTNIV